ncbi:uncharacterized protein LOC121877114 [Homarus americanus]|uniref:uncharacterized protein LOC121877114 n=1 Tax=Homarus americanus TaxID=6706 RepID=UPI001C456753|nr:uncharacterized protein LOC121877114 [Homarus americanus]
MCGATGAIVDLCDQEHHEISSITSSSSSSVEKVWKETQQLMEQSEHLVRIMTHVCSQQLSGVFRTVVKYSQGCWRRCSVDGAEGERQGPHQQLHSTCCEGPCRSQYPAGEQQQEETCRWRGPGPRWRRRGRCQSGQCEHCKNMDSGGSAGLPPAPATHHLCCPPPTPPSSTSSAPTPSPKWRTGTPSHPSILTILLLLVVTLARFTGQ